MVIDDPVAIAQDLIRVPSITIAPKRALEVAANMLAQLGFTIDWYIFNDTPNFYARLGNAAPNLCFAGHLDVVPVGDESAWTHPPFGAEIVDGILYGRGAVDMKGAIAAMIAAVAQLLKEGKPKGSISFLITGDEEGRGVDGTPAVLKALEAKGEIIDACILGEITSAKEFGDEIKIGRSGSLNGWIEASSLDYLMAILRGLKQQQWDTGIGPFGPSNFEPTGIGATFGAVNVVPAKAHALFDRVISAPLPSGVIALTQDGRTTLSVEGSQGHVAYPENFSNPIMRLAQILENHPGVIAVATDSNPVVATPGAQFNIRFNTNHTADALAVLIGEIIAKIDSGVSLRTTSTSNPYLVEKSAVSAALATAVTEVTGLSPRLTVSPAVTDGKAIWNYCQIAEFGLLEAPAHQVDEHVPLAHLRQLTDIYHRAVNHYFAAKPKL